MQQRAWTADAIRRERKAAGFGQAHRAAGFLAESHYDVERRLRERRAKVAVAERLAEARVGTLERETGMTGWCNEWTSVRFLQLHLRLYTRRGVTWGFLLFVCESSQDMALERTGTGQ